MRYSDFKIVEVTADATQVQQAEPEAQQQDGITQGPPYENQEVVRAVQQKLIDLGYPVGHTGVDGKYGPRTARAIAAFKTDFRITGDGSSLSTQDITAMQSAEPVQSPTPTGNAEGGVGSDNYGDLEFASGNESGTVRMSNRGATRNKALDTRLMTVLERAADEAGVQVVVFSGGQDQRGTPGAQRTGSIRHDNGLAADCWIYSDGQRVPFDRENPIAAKFIAACVANGAKGIGAGPGYMGGVGVHVDLWGDRAGAETWGAGGRSANTPTYVAQAYRAGETGNFA